MNIHERFMQRCLDLASLGIRSVYPNPMVGAVIVYNNQIIGEGYHKEYGKEHAEVVAIQSVKNQELLKNSVLYVSLEPCSHYGKTPPCVNLIIEKKIPIVVIADTDPNKLVSGNGVKILRENNILVITDILKEKANILNKRFYVNHIKKRPYIILKWAQSSDGFIDILRNNNEKGIYWITSPETKSLVHLWRSKEHGILVGRNTYENDSPKLDVRNVYGINPIRIIIDENLKSIYDDQNLSKTLIMNSIYNKDLGNINFVLIKPFSLSNILNRLFEFGLTSILVEGGKFTLQSFIDNNLWDESRILKGNYKLLNGIKAPIINNNNNFISLQYMFNRDKININYNNII